MLIATCSFPETATKRARASRRSLLDVPYGDGEGDKLDIYFPEAVSESEQRGWWCPGRAPPGALPQPAPWVLSYSPAFPCVHLRRILAEWKVGRHTWMSTDQGRFVFSWPMSFLRLPQQWPRAGGLATWGCVPSRFWARTPRPRCQQGRAPSKGLRGGPVLASSCFWWPPVFLGLWPYRSPLVPCLHMASVCLCLKSPFLYAATSHWVSGPF